MQIVRMCLVTMGILIWPGCERYRAQPLDSTSTVLSVQRERLLLDGSESSTGTGAPAAPPFTFARAAELMRDHSPALKDVRAEYATAQSLARVKTPLPNPALEVGPRYGFGADVLTHRFQPFGSLGFSIPTGQRLKRQDELNQVNAEVAYIETLARHRELYMQLRRQYSKFVLGRLRLAAQQSIGESANKALALTRRAQEAGNANAVDVVLFEQDDARLQFALLDVKAEIAASKNDLSQLVGVHADQFVDTPENSLPALPIIPAQDALIQFMIENHPDLARLRARYEAAEHELHLEISKQYPDFRIGPAADGDVGDRKTTLGLTLGIDLPIFDRNQQSIATARAKREEIRLKYESAAARALAELDKAISTYRLTEEKSKLLKEVLLPRAQTGIDLARRSFDQGATDVFRLLEAERANRSIQLDALSTEISSRDAFIDLEQAIWLPAGDVSDGIHRCGAPQSEGYCRSGITQQSATCRKGDEVNEEPNASRVDSASYGNCRSPCRRKGRCGEE